MKGDSDPREAAEYLSVHVRTIYRLVKQARFPAAKSGEAGGSKGVLDEWLSGQEKPFSEEKE